MSVNKAIVIGFVGADPEIRRTQDGRPVATFNMATSQRWTDKASGEKREVTDWHRIVIFNEALAKLAEQYVKKGSRIYVEGAMKTRKWTDNGGVDRYTTEIVLGTFGSQVVLLDRAERAPTPAEDAYGTTRSAPALGGESAPGGQPRAAADMDDEIPF